MKYSQIQALTALNYCRELRDNLVEWANAFACEEPETATIAFELIERVDQFLERMEKEVDE